MAWVLFRLAIFVFVQVVALVSYVFNDEPQLFRGDKCTLQNGEGVCTEIINCSSATLQIKQGMHPPLCHFDRHNPIVCCEQSQNVVVPPGNISETKRPEYNTSDSQKVVLPPGKISETNLAVSQKVVLPPGNISETKCAEYNTPDSEWVSEPIRISVVGGVVAERGEFPHMAAVGYGEEKEKRWLCGGALISPNFVLTAAHCLFSREYGNAKWVRLGDLNLYNSTDDSDVQEFTITQSIPHPSWTPSQSYNDIALLKLDRNAEITLYVKIACLYTKNDTDSPLPKATGWGRTEFLGDASDDLMQVTLEYFAHEDCSKSYPVSKTLPNGLVENTQVCAGSTFESKDTCQGDSGGPLQFKDYTKDYTKRYKIVGVTSFGKGCGIVNTPAIYTRVSAFVPWIEGIVWNN